MRERLPLILFVIALVFLSFIAGAAAFRLRLPPYDQLNRAFLAAYALKRQLFDYQTPYDTSLWFKSRDDATGVVTYDPGRTQPGLTLYTSGHANAVFLMTAEGEIVHTWNLPASKITDPDGPEEPDPFAYLRKGYVFPNGDLITFFEKINTTPFGIAIVKIDKDGNIIWSFNEPIHHDFDVAPDGRIYALNTAILEDPLEHLPASYFPMLDDEVVVLDKDGKELQRASLAKAFNNSPYHYYLGELTQANKGDHFHTNAVEVVTPELAEIFPFLKVDQALISTRHGDFIAAVDVENETVDWAIQGYWLKAHDSDMLPNGHFLLFDNLGWFGPGGQSRVLEFDPFTMENVWQYTGTEEQPLFSDVRSAQERLPNGNTLITESDQGRIFEVTPDKEIVWDFRNPVRKKDDPFTTAIVSFAHRIDPATLEGAFGEEVRAAIGGGN